MVKQGNRCRFDSCHRYRRTLVLDSLVNIFNLYGVSLINSTVRHRKSEEFPRSLCQIKYRLENKGSEPRLNDIGVRLTL